MSDIRDDARWGFEQTFGSEPSGVWSAPGAVTLLGDDAGLALGVAVNLRTVVALGLRDDAVVRVASALTGEVAQIGLDAVVPDALAGWAARPLGVVWALSGAGVDLAAVPGVDLFIESDVPVGAGLGSSAALLTAVALALNDVWRAGLDRGALARAVDSADIHATGGRGGAGPWVSLFGRADGAVLVDRRGGGAVSEPVPAAFDDAGLAVLVVDTGVPADAMSSGTADARHGASRAATEAAARTESAAVDTDALVMQAVALLREHRAPLLGDLVNVSHDLSLQEGVSSTEADLAVETVTAAGASGARVLGGGAVVAVVPLGAVSRIRVAIDGAFAEHGFGQPETFVVSPSHAASRE